MGGYLKTTKLLPGMHIAKGESIAVIEDARYIQMQHLTTKARLDYSDIHLALDVFEKDINKLHIGQQLIAYTNNDSTKKYPCTVVLIGKEL